MTLLAPRTPVDWMALGARLLNHSGIMKHSRIMHALQGHDQTCMAHAAVCPAQSQQMVTSCSMQGLPTSLYCRNRKTAMCIRSAKGFKPSTVIYKK